MRPEHIAIANRHTNRRHYSTPNIATSNPRKSNAIALPSRRRSTDHRVGWDGRGIGSESENDDRGKERERERDSQKVRDNQRQKVCLFHGQDNRQIHSEHNAIHTPNDMRIESSISLRQTSTWLLLSMCSSTRSSSAQTATNHPVWIHPLHSVPSLLGHPFPELEYHENLVCPLVVYPSSRIVHCHRLWLLMSLIPT